MDDLYIDVVSIKNSIPSYIDGIKDFLIDSKMLHCYLEVYFPHYKWFIIHYQFQEIPLTKH